MRALLKNGMIVLVPESDDAPASVSTWAASYQDHVFSMRSQGDGALALRDLGPRTVACREPINIGSWVQEEQLRLISNLAHTPFELDGRAYASVEGFWQGLKFPSEEDRKRVALLHGQPARRAGFDAPKSVTFQYEGTTYRVGTFDHWEVMRRACEAKFTQHQPARAALLATGERPLQHRVRRDSRNIPGVIMADIWMRIRDGLPRRAPIRRVDEDGDDG